MKTVYLVRHGESEGNARKFFQGRDTPLTEKGLQQASILADRCKSIEFNLLISSSMVRAKQTAEAISKASGKSVALSELFIERMRPSELIGKPIGDPVAEILEVSWEKSLLQEGSKISDGENFAEIKSRAASALGYLERCEENKILVVTHGFFLRTLMGCIIFGQNMTGPELASLLHAFPTDNTGITVITNNSRSPISNWCVRTFNDHAHLG